MIGRKVGLQLLNLVAYLSSLLKGTDASSRRLNFCGDSKDFFRKLTNLFRGGRGRV